MRIPIRLAPRTFVSVVRTSIYGSLAAFLAISTAEAKSLVDAIVMGAVLADFLTWLVMTLISLPGNLARGCYEGCLYLIFVLVLLHFGYLSGPLELDDQALAIAFLVFMLVLGIKSAWYAAAYVLQIDEG